MAEIASAYVSLVPSARGFGRATEKQVGGEVRGAGARIGGVLGTAMKAGALGVMGGLAVGGVFLKGAIADASDLAESASKVGVVFGKQAGQVKKAAKTSATAMGLSRQAYLEATGTLGNLLVSLDIAPKKSAALSQQMVKLAGDLASFNNASPEEALDALKSGLTGETEPLKRFGVNMNDATLHSEALKLGLIKNIKDGLTPQTKALAAQSLIMSQTKTAQGDFARTSGGLANQQRILAAQFSDVRAKLGTALLPVAIRVFRFLNDVGIPALSGLGDWFKRIKDPIGKAAGAIGTVAGDVKDFFTTGAGANALQTALDTIKTTVGNVSDGLGTARDAIGDMADKASGFDLGNIDANQLGESIGNALLNALTFLANSVGQITATFAKLFASVDWVGLGITLGQQVPALLLGLAAGILSFDPMTLLKGMADHWQQILIAVLMIAFAPSKFIGPLERILTRIPFVGRFLAAAVRWISELGTKITNFGKDLFSSFAKGFGSVKLPGAGFIAKVLGALKGLPGRVASFFSTLQVRIGVWALDAFEALGRAARNAIGKVPGVLAKIPGLVKRALSGAGSWLTSTGADIVRGLIGGIKSLAGDVTSALLNLLPGPLKKFAGKLGIHSPSRVFDKYGRQITEGLTQGVERTGKKPADAVGKVADKVKKKATEKLKKLVDHLKEVRDTAAGVLSDLQSTAADIASNVAGAFRPDLFSGTLGGLIGGVTSGIANVQTALAGLPRLLAAGIGGDFLQQLMASGNAQLIGQLAADPAQARALQSQWLTLQNLTGQLGQQVANQATSADIAAATAQLVLINKQLAVADQKYAKATGHALNKTAAAAKRRKKSKAGAH